MKPLHRLFILLVLGLIFGISLGVLQSKNGTSKSGESYVNPAMKGVKIGGDFNLIDDTGSPVTNKSWGDKYLLIFFGFTNCPEVCPLNLNIMTKALNNLPKEVVDKIQPLLITVDPERDTPSQMSDYLLSFHPKIIGLTGSKEQIDHVTKLYRVYEQKQEQKSMPKMDHKMMGGYTMDHSSFTYLMAPDGSLLDVFAHNTPPKEMEASLKKLVK